MRIRLEGARETIRDTREKVPRNESRRTETPNIRSNLEPPTDMSQHDVNALFQQYDADRSGAIDRNELRNAMNGLGLNADDRQCAAILAKFDANGNGVLEKGEFSHLVRELRQFQSAANSFQSAASSPDEIARIFHAFDFDRSGTIETGELCAALKALGLPSLPDDAAKILHRYDFNGNGRLEPDEFRSLVTDLHAYMRGQSPSPR